MLGKFFHEGIGWGTSVPLPLQSDVSPHVLSNIPARWPDSLCSDTCRDEHFIIFKSKLLFFVCLFWFKILDDGGSYSAWFSLLPPTLSCRALKCQAFFYPPQTHLFTWIIPTSFRALVQIPPPTKAFLTPPLLD